MKKFLLLFVMLSGMMMQQGVFAAATVSVADGVVTIKTEKAGDLKAYLQSASDADKSAIRNATTIVFKGKFNGQDIDALNGEGCCTQSVVDMENAKFIKSASSSAEYSLFKTTNDRDNSQASEGSFCIVEGTLWKKELQNPPVVSWVPATEDEYNSAAQGTFQNADGWFDDTNKESHNGEVGNGWYYKVPVSGTGAPYVYYRVEKTTNLGWNQLNYNNGDKKNNITLFADEDEMNADTSAPDYSEAIVGGTVYKYTNGSWQPVTSSGDGNYDYTQMKFDYWKNSVEEIITSKYAEGRLSDQLCTDCSKLKTLTLSAGDFALAGTVLGNNITSLETVNIQNGVTSLSAGMFNQAGTIPNQNPPVQNLKTVTFQEGCQIKILPTSVFCETGITNLSIPPSVEEIQGGAFSGCKYLTTVTIPENTNLNYIRTNAFQGCDNIEDVYVNVNPNTHPICCEYLAFGEYSLVGQTNESLETTKMATLHFNEDYWDYYAGNWKKGITFAQSQLDAIKDGCDPNAEGSDRINQSFCGNNDDLIDTYTNESNENIKRGWIEGKSPANGWQQFAKTSTGIDIIPKGQYFRTYSTDVPQVRPEWMHIYRITAFSDGFDKNNPNFNDPNSREQADNAEKKATAVEIKVDNTGGYSLIPANTGMIRVDIVTEDAFYYFMDFEDTGLTYNADWEYPYNEDLETANNQKLNFMYPTGEEDRIIGPVERGNDGKIKYRIFGLLKKPIEGTNRLTGQFSRAKNPTTLAKNRAYLKLPATLFHWTNESTGSSQNATDDATPSQYAKISLFFDEDIEDVNGGVSTEIINAIEEDMYKNDSFYTLQGVKVAKPTSKGVYIHNGKKIYIK